MKALIEVLLKLLSHEAGCLLMTGVLVAMGMLIQLLFILSIFRQGLDEHS